MKSPTYWDIAQKAGVSTATVSFAMGSNLRKVSVATRDRVVKLATEMGYRPNPLRSAWQAEVRSRRALPVQAALGFINDRSDRDWWNQCIYIRAFREGILRRSHELGYRMDNVWLPDMADEPPPVYVNKCLGVLRARGISGVLLAYLGRPARAELEWPHCAVVVVGKPERLSSYLHHVEGHLDVQHPQTHHEVNPDFFFQCHARLSISRCGRLSADRAGD